MSQNHTDPIPATDHAPVESLMHEHRLFAPSAEFVAQANVSDPAIYDEADADPEAWWASWAEKLSWVEPWTTVCEFNAPDAKWFVGGKLNVCYNCVDRHAEADPNRRAIVWEGEPGDDRTITFGELKDEISQLANALKAMGVGKGDRVSIYMPMVPELAMAMLACARIGAAHSVVFGGFTAESLQERTNDAQCKAIITADGGWRRGSAVPLLKITRAALELGCPTVEKVLVLRRTGMDEIDRHDERFVSWHHVVPEQSTDCPCEPMDSEDMLFILYTSGSTGKPKGVVHTTGGYLTGVSATAKLVFDLKPDDLHFCTADCGWITGHSYIVYGPLSNGATTLMYEGAPRPAKPGAFWEVIEKHRVTIFYTAPTAIRAFMKNGRAVPDRYDMSSLRILGTVGEPINPEAWMWYRDVIGGDRCPVVDTWWQTETGGVMISPLPGATPTKPGSATLPLPGIVADVVDLEGNSVPTGQGGYLAVRRPWPGMMRTVHGDPDRFRSSYWEHIRPADGSWLYFAGDGARRDADGYFWVMGRVDDVINVSGHRLGTMEIESALVSHPSVAEAAVVGRPDDLKGEGIVAFVTLDVGVEGDAALEAELRRHVGLEIGPIARPDIIRFTDALPKTRSGKIMRRILRSLASGQELSGDTSTLEDRSVLDQLRV